MTESEALRLLKNLLARLDADAASERPLSTVSSRTLNATRCAPC